MKTENNPLKAYFDGQHQRPLYKWDHYFDIYHRHFAPFRSQPIRLLEIGVYKGGSLDMWRDYFHRDSLIVGIDIDPACLQFEGEGVKIRIGNQQDRDFLRSVVAEFGPFDIVIDDGGHLPAEQITSFEELYPNVSPQGVYLVEDTHTNLWPNFLKVSGKTSFLAFCALKTIELMQWTGQQHLMRYFHTPREERAAPVPVSDFCRSTKCMSFYDSVVVFEKAPNREPLTLER